MDTWRIHSVYVHPGYSHNLTVPMWLVVAGDGGADTSAETLGGDAWLGGASAEVLVAEAGRDWTLAKLTLPPGLHGKNASDCRRQNMLRRRSRAQITQGALLMRFRARRVLDLRRASRGQPYSC